MTENRIDGYLCSYLSLVKHQFVGLLNFFFKKVFSKCAEKIIWFLAGFRQQKIMKEFV